MIDNESWADTHWLWHYKDHTVEVRLRDVAGQENADGNEYALMMEAANEITRLKERVVELEKAANCCRAIYFDFHVSEIKSQPLSVQAAWFFGKENYPPNKANTGE